MVDKLTKLLVLCLVMPCHKPVHPSPKLVSIILIGTYCKIMLELYEFEGNLFEDLPWNILCEIFKYLPGEIISETLLLVPLLRPLIIEQYYAKEVHLILSPTPRPHFCTPDTQKKELIDITSYGEIEDFLIDNPDINPTLIQVITSQDFRSLELLLKQFHDRLKGVQNLSIHVDSYDMTKEDIQLVMSFPNLHKFQTGRMNLRNFSTALSESFGKMQNLKELVFLGHELSDWSDVNLPPNLVNLDASWNSFTDVTTMKLPESLENLFWNQAGLRNGIFESLKFPPKLKTLMVTYNDLHWINVSQLPQTLETVDFSNNNLMTFKADSENPSWPPNLRSIFLHNNCIDDNGLKELSTIHWPPLLENLRLDENKFTTLQHLSTLPDYLKYLDLSDTHIKTFEVAHEADEYPFFTFPDLLNLLNIQNCRGLRYGALEPMNSVPPSQRVRFPENLEILNLSECNFDRLGYFIFPKHVKRLSLTGNLIRDLTTYNFYMDGKELISWTQLGNLKELELFYNNISDLQGWLPPTSLGKLDLRRNKFKILTATHTPVFNEVHNQGLVEFRSINLEQNEIHSIDKRLWLPPNLTSLNLARNNLAQFVFTPGFANHQNLSFLDLSWNQIEKISLVEEEATSHLSELNLSRNAGSQFRMSTEEFYNVFEKMNLKVTKKKHNLKSIHQFK